MMLYRIKDNRQRNLPPKIEVTDEDKVRVRFNEPWIDVTLPENGQSYRTRAAPVNTTPVNSKDLLNSNRHKQQRTVVQSYSYISSSPFSILFRRPYL